MTIHYPDISRYQTGMSLSGLTVVCVCATEGTTVTNPDFARVVKEARQLGVGLFAYHWLKPGNAESQADHYYTVAGSIPCMVDFERQEDGRSFPSMTDLAAFRHRLEMIGGRMKALYFPHWVWQSIGYPTLTAYSDCLLVASEYPAGGYSSTWPADYGGIRIGAWQWTSSYPLAGFHVDMNAFRGTTSDLLTRLGLPTPVPSQPPDPPPSRPPAFQGDAIMSQLPTIQQGISSYPVKVAQATLNVNGAALAEDGVFGPLTNTAVHAFQSRRGLASDGIIGPHTWSMLILGRDVA